MTVVFSSDISYLDNRVALYAVYAVASVALAEIALGFAGLFVGRHAHSAVFWISVPVVISITLFALSWFPYDEPTYYFLTFTAFPESIGDSSFLDGALSSLHYKMLFIEFFVCFSLLSCLACFFSLRRLRR
jgi:hypothetical protein